MHRPQSHNQRAAVRLSGSLEKKLVAYTVAATAAGIGVLASALPAEGKVVSTLSWTEILPRSSVPLDLNNDGIPDFRFSNIIYSTSVHGFRFGSLKVLPENQNNLVWGTGSSASALGSGVTVGPSRKFKSGHAFMGKAGYSCYSACSYDSSGQWKEATRLYLGLKFHIHGEIHYGWARLNVTAAAYGMFAAVTKYAYETVPKKPIVTGQGGGTEGNGYQRPRSSSPRSATPPPGSLGSLAVGAWGSSARQEPGAGRE